MRQYQQAVINQWQKKTPEISESRQLIIKNTTDYHKQLPENASQALDLLLSFHPRRHCPESESFYWPRLTQENTNRVWQLAIGVMTLCSSKENESKVKRRPREWTFCLQEHFPSLSSYSMNRTDHMATKLLITWPQGVRITGKLSRRRSTPGPGLLSAGATHSFCFLHWHTGNENSGMHKRRASCFNDEQVIKGSFTLLLQNESSDASCTYQVTISVLQLHHYNIKYNNFITTSMLQVH